MRRRGLDSLRISEQPTLPKSGQTEVFISYAWGDDTEEGQERKAIVDIVHEKLKSWNYKVIIDKCEVRYGERFSDFMKQVRQGDLVCLIVSRRYFERDDCMTELAYADIEAHHDADEFTTRTRLIATSDAKLRDESLADQVYEFWKMRIAQLDARAANIRPPRTQQYHTLKEFRESIPRVLGWMGDHKHSRGLEEILKDDFAALRELFPPQPLPR
jgi:internalin A